MPTCCCVPFCSQRTVVDAHGNKVSFLSFPSNPALRKKWIVAIRRDVGKDFTILHHTKVCSKHFTDDDFYPRYASGMKRLKENAVPSLFSFPTNAAKKQRNPPKERHTVTSATHLDEQEEQDVPDHIFQCDTASQNDPDEALESSGAHSTDTLSASNTENCMLQHRSTVCNFDCLGQRKAEVYEKTIKELELQLSSVKGELRSSKKKMLVLKCSCSRLRNKKKELKLVKETLFRVSRELELAKERLQELEKKIGKQFSVQRFMHNDDDMRFYTGLPSYAMFKTILEFLNPGDNGENIRMWSAQQSQPAQQSTPSRMGRPKSLTVENEFFLFLVRLRLGLFEKDLADRFCISIATVSRICITWTSYSFLHLTRMPLWLSKREVQEEMPSVFRAKHGSTRIILDATEIRCQSASSLALQSATFSTYKSTNTFKGLIGISPDGTVTFVSNLFPGSISDKECVRQSGFLTLPFDQGDVVMADKGFRINDLLADIGVGLNTPPFLTRNQFNEEEVQETQEIASLRIHVERRIQRIKNFHIFDRPIPLSLGPVIKEMWVVCTLLTNFQAALVRDADEPENGHPVMCSEADA
uniref:THAP-type domain-containing protein n=1 Tax=Amblyomma maculatum TaxID=34609 RepID=G3MQG1_AMBMU